MKTLVAFCTAAFMLVLIPRTPADANAQRCATPADDQAIATREKPCSRNRAHLVHP